MIIVIPFLHVLDPRLQIPSGMSSNLCCAERDKHPELLSASGGQWGFKASEVRAGRTELTSGS